MFTMSQMELGDNIDDVLGQVHSTYGIDWVGGVAEESFTEVRLDPIESPLSATAQSELHQLIPNPCEETTDYGISIYKDCLNYILQNV